jgi:hypothetical protein
MPLRGAVYPRVGDVLFPMGQMLVLRLQRRELTPLRCLFLGTRFQQPTVVDPHAPMALLTGTVTGVTRYLPRSRPWGLGKKPRNPPGTLAPSTSGHRPQPFATVPPNTRCASPRPRVARGTAGQPPRRPARPTVASWSVLWATRLISTAVLVAFSVAGGRLDTPPTLHQHSTSRLQRRPIALRAKRRKARVSWGFRHCGGSGR